MHSGQRPLRGYCSLFCGPLNGWWDKAVKFVVYPYSLFVVLFNLTATVAKPFLKWAGGKGKVLPEIIRRLPPGLKQGQITSYAELFIGGGAVSFYLAQCHAFERLLIGDVNKDLFLAYTAIREDPEHLLTQLRRMQNAYNRLGYEEQAAFYYQTRAEFNAARAGWRYDWFEPAWTQRAVQLMFLNRTCFNGLYRVNSRAEFNVPFGKYRTVNFGDPENIRTVARLLERTVIQHGDFSTSAAFADERTFVYLDPPYRPLTATASFTSYARLDFGEAEQLRLAAHFKQLNERGSFVMLSNSDPFSATGDDFFERLYAGFTFSRLLAKRAINANGANRGAVSELLITNY